MSFLADYLLYPEDPLHYYSEPLVVVPARKQRASELSHLAQLLQHCGVEDDKDSFKVTLDVQQFSPNEIEITVKDRYVIVKAKHEEKRDEHGWISREFTRKYLIPENYDIEQVSSKLSSDGVLTLVAPSKKQPQLKGEKVIPIQRTGKPALKSEASLEKKESEKK